MTFEDLCLALREVVANDVDRLPTLLMHINAGVQDAINKERNSRASYDVAFRAALSLTSPKRITGDVREALNDAILKVISKDGISKGERDVLDRLKP